MYAVAGLDRAGIVATALTTLGYDEAAMAAALGKIS
jgi:1-deoxy-D-xylulose-5-phosphate synthase